MYGIVTLKNKTNKLFCLNIKLKIKLHDPVNEEPYLQGKRLMIFIHWVAISNKVDIPLEPLVMILTIQCNFIMQQLV
jgi:hypothetical protein